MQNLIVEAALLLFLIFTSLSVILNKDLLSVVMIYGAFSFCAVLLYFMMGSPDVAFTEAVIGVATTIYFVVALKNLDRWCK